jgi:hypothetical protein
MVMPAFHEMDLDGYVKREERLVRDPDVMREIEEFEDWTANVEAPITVHDAPGSYFTGPDSDGSNCRFVKLELMEHYYEIPIGLHENVYRRVRLEGIQRRVRNKRVRMKTIWELKASAEW